MLADMSLLGKPAPDFTLPSSQGDITLSELRGKHVVLIFYPLDFGPVCSMQVPEYSAQQNDFEKAGAVVLGINRDSVYAHKAWSAEYGIEVPLISDMKLEVAKLYQIPIDERFVGGRAIFLIDKEGIVRLEHREEKIADNTLRPAQVLEKIKELA